MRVIYDLSNRVTANDLNWSLKFTAATKIHKRPISEKYSRIADIDKTYNNDWISYISHYLFLLYLIGKTVQDYFLSDKLIFDKEEKKVISRKDTKIELLWKTYMKPYSMSNTTLLMIMTLSDSESYFSCFRPF